ncbi:MAG: hypothetical protein JO121_00620 [Deltaproteobacteria bacterium]|nr:hypothetical protein [Deltaproteobacteria bacterium]
MLKRNVEQGNVVFYRPPRRIPDFGDERIYFEQEFRLAFAHWRQVGFSGPGFVDCKGEFMVLVFELGPSPMEHRDRGVRAFSHNRSSAVTRDPALFPTVWSGFHQLYS